GSAEQGALEVLDRLHNGALLEPVEEAVALPHHVDEAGVAQELEMPACGRSRHTELPGQITDGRRALCAATDQHPNSQPSRAADAEELAMPACGRLRHTELLGQLTDGHRELSEPSDQHQK